MVLPTLPCFQTDSLGSDIVAPFITSGPVVYLDVLSTILRPPRDETGWSDVELVLD